jgi:hypothetical protein
MSQGVPNSLFHPRSSSHLTRPELWKFALVILCHEFIPCQRAAISGRFLILGKALTPVGIGVCYQR